MQTIPISAAEMAGLDTATLEARFRHLQGSSIGGAHQAKLRAELVRLDLELDQRRKQNAVSSADETID